MAGNAISPLLKISGDDAIAMACAAFCIPTSMTIVRLTAVLEPLMRDKPPLHSMASRMSNAPDNPNNAKLLAISRRYCRKNTVASVISAGKANLPSTSATFFAATGLILPKRLPASNGTKSNTMQKNTLSQKIPYRFNCNLKKIGTTLSQLPRCL